MHWTRFAPELSATSRNVRIWIMTTSLLHELLDELRHDEPLAPRERGVLGDFHLVADLELVLLVVRLEAAPALHVLAVERVAAVRHHLDDDRLVHLVLGDLADHRAAEAMLLRC